jgi:hypothetical protein
MHLSKPYRVWLTRQRRRQLLLRLNRQGTAFSLSNILNLTGLSRVRKRKRAEPTPRNAFPHVVEKVICFIIHHIRTISLLHPLLKGLGHGF